MKIKMKTHKTQSSIKIRLSLLKEFEINFKAKTYTPAKSQRACYFCFFGCIILIFKILSEPIVLQPCLEHHI